MKTDEVAAPTVWPAMEESFAVARLDELGRPVEWRPATSWAHATYAARILSQLGDLHRAVVHRIEEVLPSAVHGAPNFGKCGEA